MEKIELKCRACGEEIKVYVDKLSQEITVLAVHTECAIIYAKAA